MQTHEITMCGLTRLYPVSFVGKKTKLVHVSILGDVELVEAIIEELTQKIKHIEYDFLAVPDAKTAPLVQGIAQKLSHKKYIVCRKAVKPYMVSPIILKPLPHFPKHVKQLVMNKSDADLLNGKRVVVIDDVVSTGVTLRMMKKIIEKAGASVVANVSVFRQGKQFDDIQNFTFLHQLPIFTEKISR